MIEFATAEDIVLRSQFLQGNSYNDMILIPWSKSYRSKIIRWHTEVAIDIGTLPVHACFQRCLEPLLSSCCSIKTCTFNKHRGTCLVVGLALNVRSIPYDGHVAIQYDQGAGVCMEAFPVTMRAYLLSEAPEFSIDPSPPGSPARVELYDTAMEFGVDPEVLREVYEEQDREAQEQQATRAASHSPVLYNSGYSLISSETSDDGWESNRSWHLRYAQ